MLVDETKYMWSRWQQPIFTSNSSWGKVTASSVHKVTDSSFEPFHALDGNDDTHYESTETVLTANFKWVFDKPLKIYRIELINKPTGSTYVTKTVEVYADEAMVEPIITGSFPVSSKSRCDLEPDTPFACDSLILKLGTDTKYVGLTSIRIIAEVGKDKAILTPYLNTSEEMETVSAVYNDDNTYTIEGLEGFMFDGRVASPMYISSNHWIGFGTSSEQLRILRRDGCSTAIYKQLIHDDEDILKIRFEGYTVYNSRVEANRLIFELFLLSNNDMVLNVIQTPTSSFLGTSDFSCNNTYTPLDLVDGSGGGTMVSFYHQDDKGKTWDIQYSMYISKSSYTCVNLIKLEDTYYSIESGVLVPVIVENLSAAMFMKYGFDVLPSPQLLTPLTNPQILQWNSGGDEKLIKANLKAYPYPQTITSVADMNHVSILGIKLMTAEYSGDVTVAVSFDNGETFSEEIALSTWLNTPPEDIWNNLNEEKRLILQFVLHDNAAISRFKITYIN